MVKVVIGKPAASCRKMVSMQNRADAGRHPQKEEDIFRKAFLESSAPMSITTVKEGRFFDVNNAFLEMAGLDRHEVTGLIAADTGLMTAAQHSMLLNEIREHGRAAEIELAVGTKGGDTGCVLVNSSILSIGGEEYMLSVFKDISKRKRAEVALRASEKRYRTVYENTTLGIFETTPSGKVIHANKTFAWMFGFGSSEEVVRELTDLARQIYVNPDRRSEIIDKVMESRIPRRFETEYRRRDGSSFTAILEIQAVWSEGDGQFHLFGFVEDISQRKQAEARQLIAEELYRTLAEKSFAGVYVVQDGRFMFINSNAAQYAGYAKEELLGHSSTALIHPEDREGARKCAMEMIKGKRDTPYEFRIVTKQGESRWIMETASSINYLGTPAILCNSMDITEFKSIAAEREDIILQLQKALLKVKKLSGLIPICASCKKIRNDEGYWEQLERYIKDRSEAEFSHGICPDCAKRLYAGYFEDER